jgi:hypothetical protein
VLLLEMTDPRKYITMVATQVEQSNVLSNTRVQRILNRDRSLGFAANDFDAITGTTFRIYFDPATSLIDVPGDKRLAALITDTFDFTEQSVEETARLTNRPFYQCKFDLETPKIGDPLVLYYKRPIDALSHERDQSVPFGDGDNIYLFEDDIIEPRFIVYVDEIRQSTKYDAASGVLMVTIVTQN